MQALRIEEAKKHVFFHHEDADGYIVIAKKDKETGRFRQHSYKPENLAEHLSEWMGEDVFFSQQTFYKPQRRIENIRQLRSLYVDLDFYLWNYDPKWVLGKLEYEFYGKTIPEPNLIIFSGQGIVLVWLLEPVPCNALPLWQAVQNYFLEQLKSLGGDSRAAEAARIFRIAGSTSSKNGETVSVQYRTDYRYELRQLQYDYLPELKERTGKKRPGRKKKVVHMFNLYSLNHARLMDLAKLIELRDYEVTGYRETICFLYRYWSCCFTSSPETAIEQTLSLNDTFTRPLPERELKRATRSAEKAYMAKSNKQANEEAIKRGFPGAGYNLSNAKIIKWLDILPEEMRHLKTIIDTKEKRRRDYEKKLVKRREAGMQERSAYIQAQADKTEKNLQTIREILQDNPTLSVRKLAEASGFSKSYVQKLKAML